VSLDEKSVSVFLMLFLTISRTCTASLVYRLVVFLDTGPALVASPAGDITLMSPPNGNANLTQLTDLVSPAATTSDSRLFSPAHHDRSSLVIDNPDVSSLIAFGSLLPLTRQRVEPSGHSYSGGESNSIDDSPDQSLDRATAAATASTPQAPPCLLLLADDGDGHGEESTDDHLLESVASTLSAGMQRREFSVYRSDADMLVLPAELECETRI
jgi:hypothetical protein